MGALLAAQRCGLEKVAFLGGLGKAMPEVLSQIGRAGEGMHPALSRALIGGGIGAAGGAMSDDIGAGRGMLAGALAGAGSAWGSQLGRQSYEGAWNRGLEKIKKFKPTEATTTGEGRRGMQALKTEGRQQMKALREQHQQLQQDFGRRQFNPGEDRYMKLPMWNRNLEAAGNVGGLGMGALAGGGALLATNPSKPKHWWE
jgi:hypothetical protein